jgi:alkylhydroperoxidase/carboxymuconolactone decarboxylase family protein YurZ
MTLNQPDLRLVRLSVAICLGDWETLRRMREDACEGEPDRRWREAVLQAHLFAGIPRVVEACEVLEAAGGLGVPEEQELVNHGDRFDEGHELFGIIYGPGADAVRKRLQGYHPVLERWIEGHAYGRVLSRSGLSPGMREILAMSCLAALRQNRQLASHVRGALYLGEPIEHLREAVQSVEDLIGADALRHASRVIGHFAR